MNGPLISPKISFFDPHGQKLGKIVNFDTSGMTHNDVIIFEKNRIEEKSQNKYLEKEFWKFISFRQRYENCKVYLPSLRSASVLTLQIMAPGLSKLGDPMLQLSLSQALIGIFTGVVPILTDFWLLVVILTLGGIIVGFNDALIEAF